MFKFVCSGISYLSRTEETELRNKLVKKCFPRDIDIDNTITSVNEEISFWLSTANTGDVYKLKEKYQNNPEVLYFLHKNLRERQLWSYYTENGIYLKKVNHEEFKELVQNENLENEFLDSLLGFTKVFRLLTALRKPIIGHNILIDLSLLAHTFESQLPRSYKKYKVFIHNLFPVVYDTKTISYELRNSLPENKRWKQNLLETLYPYFKDGDGRHLALNSPYITVKDNILCNNFHNAGFDSYCTGYIFIRMAHILVSKGNNNPKQTYMCGQLLNAVSPYKNCLNVIRGTIAYVVSIIDFLKDY